MCWSNNSQTWVKKTKTELLEEHIWKESINPPNHVCFWQSQPIILACSISTLWILCPAKLLVLFANEIHLNCKSCFLMKFISVANPNALSPFANWKDRIFEGGKTYTLWSSKGRKAWRIRVHSKYPEGQANTNGRNPRNWPDSPTARVLTGSTASCRSSCGHLFDTLRVGWCWWK